MSEIDELRGNLTEKLGELHRRATRARVVLSPSTYWDNLWVRVGIGVAIGYAMRRRPGTAVPNHESLVHAIVRAGLSAAASGLVIRALAAPATSKAAEP